MSTLRFFLIFALFTGLNACKSPEIAIDPALDAKPMPVKGRQGLMIGQVIRFGAYKTNKVERGWTGSYDLPFVLRFRGAKEKLHFTQYAEGGAQAEVSCISRFKSTELPLLKDYFSVPIDLKNYFAGVVAFGDGSRNWDFILHNPNGDFLREEASAGFAQNGEKRIEINAIRGLKDQPKWLQKLTVYGHEFRLNGRPIGAVSTLNKGKVWIDPSLDIQTRTVVAAIATGLLLRNDVEETANDATR